MTQIDIISQKSIGQGQNLAENGQKRADFEFKIKNFKIPSSGWAILFIWG